MTRVAITSVGLVSALGDGPTTLQRLAEGDTGVRPPEDHRRLLPLRGIACCDVEVRKLLRKRKDIKLMARAAQLAVAAAHEATGGVPLEADTALFLGVGREPPDEGQTERALVAAMVDGQLDADRLGEAGRAAYPPLAALRTLPNMVLAHTAIQLGIRGEGGTRTGQEAAGLAALVAGWQAVVEGRATEVLAGGADSWVSAGVARDLVRLGRLGASDAAGEGAALFRLTSEDHAARSGATVLGWVEAGWLGFEPACRSWRSPLEPTMGACGAAAAPMAVAVSILRGRTGQVVVTEGSGALAGIRWTVSAGREGHLDGGVRSESRREG